MYIMHNVYNLMTANWLHVNLWVFWYVAIWEGTMNPVH